MGDETTDMVPRSRLNEVIAQRNEARAKITALEDDLNKVGASAVGYKQRVQEMGQQLEQAQQRLGSIEDLEGLQARAKSAEGLEAKVKELEGELAQQQDLRRTDATMRNVDDEDARDLVRRKFEAQREDGVGDFDKFWGKLQKDAPKWLQPFLGDGAEAPQSAPDGAEGAGAGEGTPAADGGQEGAAGTPPTLPGNQGAVQTPPVADDLDPVAIANMPRSQFQESGILDQYNKR